MTAGHKKGEKWIIYKWGLGHGKMSPTNDMFRPPYLTALLSLAFFAKHVVAASQNNASVSSPRSLISHRPVECPGDLLGWLRELWNQFHGFELAMRISRGSDGLSRRLCWIGAPCGDQVFCDCRKEARHRLHQPR